MALTHSVSKRLEYVEFLLMFRGWVYRHDLVDYFGISEAAATRDFKDYKHLCPNNMDMNNGTKRWELRDSSFESYFPITQSTVFSKFKMPGICESLGLGTIGKPPRLSMPSMDVLSRISRAIAQKSVVQVKYAAASGPQKTIEIVPHSLVDNGIRWHVRSYDREKGIFWDFVLGRLITVEKVSDQPKSKETKDYDLQWNREVRLELMPHPNKENLAYPDALAIEYGMEDNVLSLNIRAAVVGYLLRLWNVDCSKGHTEKGKHMQLALKNPMTLYDVNSAVMAPGYDLV